MAFTPDDHPNWYEDVPGMRLLILGTFPPHKRRRHFEFYFPNKSNRFWSTMASLNDHSLQYFEEAPAVEERKRLMKALNIGVQNIGRRIRRKRKSSADRDIRITEFQDIRSILERHRGTLRSILLTGFTPPTSTFHEFIKYLEREKIGYTPPRIVGARETFKIDGFDQITCYIGNSTSRAARRVADETLKEQFRKAWQG